MAQRSGPALATVLLLLLLMVGQAWAETPPTCQPHAGMVALLQGKYSEQLWAVALQNNGRMVEVYSTDDGATWTILVTRPDGLSCIAAAGTDFETISSAVPEQESYHRQDGWYAAVVAASVPSSSGAVATGARANRAPAANMEFEAHSGEHASTDQPAVSVANLVQPENTGSGRPRPPQGEPANQITDVAR